MYLHLFVQLYFSLSFTLNSIPPRSIGTRHPHHLLFSSPWCNEKRTNTGATNGRKEKMLSTFCYLSSSLSSCACQMDGLLCIFFHFSPECTLFFDRCHCCCCCCSHFFFLSSPFPSPGELPEICRRRRPPSHNHTQSTVQHTKIKQTSQERCPVDLRKPRFRRLFVPGPGPCGAQQRAYFSVHWNGVCVSK